MLRVGDLVWTRRGNGRVLAARSFTDVLGGLSRDEVEVFAAMIRAQYGADGHERFQSVLVGLGAVSVWFDVDAVKLLEVGHVEARIR